MHKCKNILLVYPKYSKTFWSFDHILEIIGKKAAFPPLGLLSIASMLPENWNKILVDMNVENLKDSDIQWADFIFISAMIVQKESVLKTIEKIKKFKKPIVAGGPLFTTSFEEFSEVDHIFLGEAEETLPIFLEDTEKNSLKRFYSADSFPDVKKIPVPSWDLVKISRYNSMCIPPL